MIKLQRELKQTSSRLAAQQSHAGSLEETLRTERPAYERAAREIGEEPTGTGTAGVGSVSWGGGLGRVGGSC